MYKYDKKEVKIGSDVYEAIYPENHSAVEAIVWDSYDANSMDQRPGVHRAWRRIFYILWKGAEEWKLVPNDGSEGFENLTYNIGIYAVLRECETDEWKAARWAVLRECETDEWKAARWAEDRVKDLKENIPQARKELKDMEKEYLRLTGRSI